MKENSKEQGTQIPVDRPKTSGDTTSRKKPKTTVMYTGPATERSHRFGIAPPEILARGYPGGL